jgi:antitoxin VapB
MAALLAQLDRVPDRPDAFDPLEWDAHGLPK